MRNDFGGHWRVGILPWMDHPFPAVNSPAVKQGLACFAHMVSCSSELHPVLRIHPQPWDNMSRLHLCTGQRRKRAGEVAELGKHKHIVSAHTVSWQLFRKKQVVTSQLPCFPRRAQGTEERKTLSLLWIQLSQMSLFPPAWVAFAVFVACTVSWETPSSAQEVSDPGPTWTAQQQKEPTMIRKHVNPEPGSLESWQLFQIKAGVINPLIC